MKDELETLAAELGRILSERGLKLVTAESCTGGWIAKTITDVPGSSGWLDRGFVTYSNDAKSDMLGVDADTIARQGAVSKAVVAEMAMGALANSPAEVSVAVSGIAGPGGGSADKPVGTVWFAWSVPETGLSTHCECFDGDREAVRRQTVVLALKTLIRQLS